MKHLDKNEAKKLWKILKDKDEFTAEHCRRVQGSIHRFAILLGWKDEDINWLKMGALLHDLGKVDIPDELYEKIRDGEKLTPRDKETIREHAGHTLHIEEYDEIPSIVENILKYHHERYDGTGYPFGLEGDAIPLEVRMLSIADYYDSILNRRPERIPSGMRPMSKEDGIKILIEEAVIRFDPSLVERFIRLILSEADLKSKAANVKDKRTADSSGGD